MATFALTPTTADDGIIDFTTTDGKKSCKSATEILDSDDRFDCSPEDLYQFLQMVDTRATECGWNDETNGSSQIPEIPGDNGADKHHLISKCGTSSHEHIKDHESHCIDQEDRKAQDTVMSHHCLVKSLTKEARNKIMLHKKDCIAKINAKTTFSGLLFLKVTIRDTQ